MSAIFFLVAGVSLGACGSSTPSTSSATTAARSSETVSSAAGPNYGTLTYAQVEPGANDWPIYAAIAEGFFKKEGLRVSLAVSGSSPGGVQEVLASAINVASCAESDVMTASAHGGSVVMVAGEENTLPYTVNVAKGITSVAQLSGKKVGLAGPTNITKVVWNAIAKANGLNPASVTYLYMNTAGNMLAGLKSGVIQGATLLPPFTFEGEAAGYRSVATAAKYLSYPFTGMAVSPTWAKANSAKLLAFLKGYLLGIKWLYNPSNKQAAITVLVNATKTTTAAAIQSYDFFINQLKTFPTNGAVPLSHMNGLANAMVGLGVFKQAPPVSKYVDNSYIAEAAKQLGVS